METLAYLQVAKEQEHPSKEITLEGVQEFKMSGKLTGALLGAAGAALTVGLADAPAQAYGYDYGHGCGDYCSYPTYIGGGYQVTSYQTYDVSYDYGGGCYDYGCGGGYGGGGYGGGGYDRPPRQLHDAVCSSCGIQTQVPFQPNGSKPVYCRECYQNSSAYAN